MARCSVAHSLRAKRRAWAPPRALLLTLVLASTALSGCVGADWLKTRPSPITAEEFGLVRYHVAAKPGGLPEDFLGYNVTVGAIEVVFDQLGESTELIAPGGQVVDLLFLEREKKALKIAERYVQTGHWQGFVFGVTDAEVTRRSVVGNRDGEAVYERETIKAAVPIPSGKTQQRAMVIMPHSAFPGMTVDVFLEIDVKRSLEAKGHDRFEHRSNYYSASLYIDDVKVRQDFFSGAYFNEKLGMSQWGGQKQKSGPLVPQPPTPVLVVTDAWQENVYKPHHSRLLPRALALGAPYLFDASGSLANMYLSNGDRMPVVEHAWDFGDGTTARGEKVWKTFTTGGVFDVELRIRDGLDSYASTWVTVFVPYPAGEATEKREETRSGTLVGGGAATPLDLGRASYRLTFEEDLVQGVWNLGAYRITVSFDDPAGLAEDDDVTVVRVNATSEYLDKSVEGTSPIVVETAGVPIWRVVGPPDWVGSGIDLEIALLQGATVDFEVRVEALYFGNLSRGIDSHGNHIHGAWRMLFPYFDHLSSEGAFIRPYPEGFDPDDPDGSA